MRYTAPCRSNQPCHLRAATVSIRWVPLAVLVCILAGCLASAPRFRSGRGEEPDRKTTERPTPAQEVLEEDRENDSLVDISAVLPLLDSASTSDSTVVRHKVMDEILAMIGTPYAFSGTDSVGIDCSGFTSKIYAEALGKQLPHSTADQYAAGIPVDDSHRTFGDLVFFRTYADSPSHVGIYLGEDLFAHASVSNGVTISSLASTYYKKRYVGTRRILE